MTDTTSLKSPRIHQARELREGSGEPVLFLHGAGGFPGKLPFFGELASTNEILVPEHPNFGASEDAPELRNVADYAYYYLDWIKARGLSRVHLMGHSLGGWIAAEMAVRDCSAFASLTLISPAGVRVKGVPSGDNFIWGPEESIRKLFHDQKLAEQILARTPSEEEVAQMIRTRLIAARLGWEPRWFNPGLERWLHRITCPALLLWGAQDNLLPAAYAPAWAARVPNLSHHIIEACGHSPHVEQTATVLSYLRPFLQEHAA
jgi:pimeloyl-ACP methyl ester carboxylesterase